MIITDESILRTKCLPADESEIGSIVDQLQRELEHSEMLGRPGIGLAAIQIGIPKNIAIIRLPNYSINLVNCKIKNAYNKKLFKDEGCLSVPNRTEDTMRFQEIHVVDNLVGPKSFIATGLLAVVVQHELDHLNGKLFFDDAIHETASVCRAGRCTDKNGKLKPSCRHDGKCGENK